MSQELLRAPAPQPVRMLAAGAKGVQTVYGRRAATGSIVFAGQPTAGDTITINGTVFTARASGATGNEFNIGGSLSLTLDAIVTVLNASAVAGVALATYAKIGSNDTLGVTYDVVGEAGNAFTLAENSSNASVSAATLAGGSDGDGFNLEENSVFELITDAGGNQSFVLPAAQYPGQEITIFFRTKGSGANAVISGNYVGSNVALTLDNAGEWARLQWLGGDWIMLANNSASLA
jgi:hypothetical protein